MKSKQIGRRKNTKLSLIMVSLLIVSLISVLFPVAVLADGTSPVIISPANGATETEVTGITFSWEAFDEFTTAYIFQLSSDVDFTTLIADEEIYDVLSYTYSGTLDYSTDYYWRVQAYDPNPSEWTEASFTTKASGSDGSDSSSANTTDGTTSTTSGNGDSFIDSAIDYLGEIGWPLVGGMAFVLVVLIVLVVMLLTKPKKSRPSGMGDAAMGPGMGGPGMGPGMSPGAGPGMGPGMGPGRGPQNQCPSCGTVNSPDRKFCSNCGGNLMAGQAFQQKQAPPAGPGGTICQNCGSPIAPGRQFCGVCGTKTMPPQQPGFQTSQAPPSNNCVTCGSPLQPGQQFCGSCGTPVVAGQQMSNAYQTQMFMCPICGTSINRGVNPCPGCNTWLDWGA